MSAADVIEAEAVAARAQSLVAKGGTPCLHLPRQTLAEAREDRSKKQILDQAFAECVAKMGPPPIMVHPLPIVGTNTYAPEPCSNPRQSYRASHTPHCFCGWPMGSHKTAEVIDFPQSEIDIAYVWSRP